MSENSLFSLFDHVFCINLPRCTERRAHIEREFAQVEIEPAHYTFIEAIDKDGPEVEARYRAHGVVSYPPCFRCGRMDCEHPNKWLLPPQIANWLSHMKAWACVAEKCPRLGLICEDDVKFLPNYRKNMQFLSQQAEVWAAIAAGDPVLLRLGVSGDPMAHLPPQLSQEVRMSNCCYAITPTMAEKLLAGLEVINTTSDIYVHRQRGAQFTHFTLVPPLAHDLSWTTGQMASEIRPKVKHLEHLEQALAQLPAGTAEYAALAEKMEIERLRLRQHEKDYARPITYSE